ncbi:thiamine pyrophosphokinase-related protein-like protein [Xylaria arbuscula]|nr:thiamine pyrophosphokinase-related protein-like protein [Xylaria arbuscula]
MSAHSQFKCLLDVVNHCDDFPLPEKDLKAYTARVNNLYHFTVGHDPTALGFVLPEVAAKFSKCAGWSVNDKTTPKTLTLSGGHDYESRSEIVESTLAQFKNARTFGVLEKWRGELKPCYGLGGNVLFAIERAAFPLLGIVAYGVVLLAYTRDGDGGGGGIKGLWVQRRSREARTHPGLLDGTVAGGVPIHSRPFTTLVNEAREEASFPRELVAQRARPCGTLSYFHTRRRDMGGEVGLLQPGVHFLYDMEVPEGVRPRSSDPDVDGFELMSPERVRWEILAENVKPWSALAIIDFFIRHGVIHEENEKDFVEISMRLHRNLGFPVSGVSFLMNHLHNEKI